MRCIVLGAPIAGRHLNRWKSDLAEDAERIGWSIEHLHARGIPTEEVVNACRGADMLLWSRTHGYNPDGDIPAMLRRIEDGGTKTVGHHMDLYWGATQAREAQVGNSPWWTCQYVFTADGGHAKAFADRGVNHHWCPPAVGSHWVGRGTPDHEKYPGRVIFVGGFAPRIHGPHRGHLIRMAQRFWPRNFEWYGSQGRTGVWGENLADLYASAHAAIGDSAQGDYYWSDRVVNTLARGGLLAHPRVRGMYGQGFTNDVMLLFDRNDFRRMRYMIERTSAVQRREITDRAMALIEERHTWKVRLQQIAEVVFP